MFSSFWGCGPQSGDPQRHFSHRRGGWGFDPRVGFGFWGVPGGKRGGRGGRMFEQGDLKYVILQLLEEKPRHGYEIIKELEERFAGMYSPSPGTVYPTLTMLEDLGYARARADEGGRKVYEITDEGRAHLGENRSTVDDIFERMASFGSSFFSDAMMDVNRAFADLGRSVYSMAWRGQAGSDRMRRTREILEQAGREIADLGRSGGTASESSPRPEPGGA